MFRFTILAVWASNALLPANAVAVTHTIIKERVAELPAGWQQHHTAAPTVPLTLSVALRQPHIGYLKARLLQISDPDHADYGFHLSRDEVHALRAPSQEAANLVVEWLSSHGIANPVLSHDWIHFNSSVEVARKLLNAEFAWYSYHGHEPVLRTRAYSTPAAIAEMVDLIHPITNFLPPTARKLPKLTKAPSKTDSLLPRADPCTSGVNPACLKELYNINYTAPEGRSPARFGIAGFLEQFINYQDTATFMQKYAPELPQSVYNFTVELINGGENPQEIRDAGLEASLDVQYAMGLGYPTNVIYYSTAGRGVKLDEQGDPYPILRTDNEPFVEWLEYLLAKPDSEIPHVVSISYADDEQSVPIPYALRVCDMFAALAARGVTVVSASGDGGAQGTGQRQCYSNDGARRPETIPTFPASCPFVTCIGAVVNGGPPTIGAGYSTGGFSNLFPRPPWQDAAVLPAIEKLANISALTGRYNASGRAIPDISAVGSSFAIEWAGGPSSVLGTSASTPVVGAMLALINDARLRAGKNSTGWINPFLYSDKMSGVIQDIVDGASQPCRWDDNTRAGWQATPGFDMITGLGVPNDFSKLLEAFMA